MGLAAVESKSKKRYSIKSALANEPQWSHYQKAIFDWVENGQGNLQVGAVAGSGKSTVLTAIVARLPKDAKIQIIAFNKHIVDVLKLKLPTRVGCSTAHGMGNYLLARYFDAVPHLHKGKYRKIARPFIAAVDVSPYVKSEEDYIREYGFDEKEAEIRRKAAIVLLRRNWMKFALDLVKGCQSTLSSAKPDQLCQLIGFYGIDSPAGKDEIIPLIADILEEGDRLAREQNIVDFGDMLWLPHCWNLQPSAKDWLLIDEVQDANRAQLSLYEKLGRNGRVVVVGDRDQAIQGFAFSSPKMWDEIGQCFKAETLPLSLCYRCPTSHVDLARHFVPSIEAAADAIDGTICVIHPDNLTGMVKDGDLILCRFTAPLVGACLSLIKRGIPAKVRGLEIGLDIARLADIGESSWRNFTSVITSIMIPEIDKFREDGEDDRADAIKDNLDSILLLYGHFSDGCDSLAQFIEKIESLFSDSESPVILSTIHRSKGDESDRVFILKSNVLPYRRDGMQDWQKQQEDNLAYVALTRAKQSMFMVPIGMDDKHTASLMKMRYGGFDVDPHPREELEISAIIPAIVQPHKVGDRFNFLNCGPHEITAVIANGNSWEYAAEYKGEPFMLHWHCNTYSHNLIEIINTLED